MSPNSPYFPLQETTVVDYIWQQDEIRTLFAPDSRLTAQEVGDGNLNQIFIVREDQAPHKAVIVKQALPYLRVAGESWPLSLERMRFETQALLKQNEIVPGLVPAVYHSDESMSLVVMEFLGEHEVMRKPLIARRQFPRFADHISTLLARMLYFTSDLYLTGQQKKELQAIFINPHLCKITEDFVYSNPYMTSPENQWNPLLDKEIAAIRSNGPLKVAIAEMKEAFMAQAQALIHGDLHTGSVMLNESDTRVIDPEFAFYGPMGFDIGAVLENLVLNYLSHFAHTPDPEVREPYQAYLLETIRQIWLQFAQKFEGLWMHENRGDLPPAAYWDFEGGEEAFCDFRARYLRRVLHDTAGHGGCKMLRRMMGIVSVMDITSIVDLNQRAQVERLALKIGTRWVLERSTIDSIDDLITIVKEESHDC
jgi:5-methylthioribose kinase